MLSNLHPFDVKNINIVLENQVRFWSSIIDDQPDNTAYLLSTQILDHEKWVP